MPNRRTPSTDTLKADAQQPNAFMSEMGGIVIAAATIGLIITAAALYGARHPQPHADGFPQSTDRSHHPSELPAAPAMPHTVRVPPLPK